jgi:hypothetical protein
VIVTSIEAHELKTQELKNEGPKKLEAYLAFAQHVGERGYEPKALMTRPSDYSLAEKMALENSALQRRLEACNLTWTNGSEIEYLVFTDDAPYSKIANLKSPHAYMPLLLGLKNWSFI